MIWMPEGKEVADVPVTQQQGDKGNEERQADESR